MSPCEEAEGKWLLYTRAAQRFSQHPQESWWWSLALLVWAQLFSSLAAHVQPWRCQCAPFPRHRLFSSREKVMSKLRFVKMRKTLKKGVSWQYQPSKTLKVSCGRVAASFWEAIKRWGCYSLSSHGWNPMPQSKVRDEKLWVFQCERAESIKIVSLYIYRLWKVVLPFFFLLMFQLTLALSLLGPLA